MSHRETHTQPALFDIAPHRRRLVPVSGWRHWELSVQQVTRRGRSKISARRAA